MARYLVTMTLPEGDHLQTIEVVSGTDELKPTQPDRTVVQLHGTHAPYLLGREICWLLRDYDRASGRDN